MSQKSSTGKMRIVAENVTETVWLRLRRLTSKNLCRAVIQARGSSLPASVLDKKADGVASAVKSALGYWEQNTTALNAKILSRYYAILQMSIAEQVASNEETADLEDIQRHTELGHGLATISDPTCSFPYNYNIACLKSGHFSTYCRYRGINITGHALERRPREWDKLSGIDKGKLVSLADLFRRVPELQQIVSECLDAPALSLHIGYATQNFIKESKAMKAQIRQSGRFISSTPADESVSTTYVAIYSKGPKIDSGYIYSLGFPFRNIREEKDNVTETSYLIGEIVHPSTELWWSQFEPYKSGYCGTSIIAPFWGDVRDPFVIHFMILYACSIIVRYLPSLWHNIEDGDLNHIRALIEYYLSIVDNVLPQIAMERITGIKTYFVQPGSTNAPI